MSTHTTPQRRTPTETIGASLVARFRRTMAGRHSGPALSAGLGALAALGHAPVSFPPATLAALAVAIAALSAPVGWRRAAGLGLALGTGYFAVSWFWIVEPFLVDPWRHGWMAPFALLFLSAGMALYWAGAAAVAQAAGRTAPARALWLVVALTAGEMLRSVLFTGFPWALVGHVWIGWPQMQLAALGGADSLTLLTLGAAALPA
ncbi:MAG: hypothetical protein GVX90_03870, partial [Alphaproteobacteria bacterium]|nr:hypothetical protein [Alphaproteobacteria bacterium]